MGGLEIHDDSPEIDPVSPVVLGSFLKYGLTEISTLTLTLTLTLTIHMGHMSTVHVSVLAQARASGA